MMFLKSIYVEHSTHEKEIVQQQNLRKFPMFYYFFEHLSMVKNTESKKSIWIKLTPDLALSSLYCVATSLNFIPALSFSKASRILDCFSQRTCLT